MSINEFLGFNPHETEAANSFEGGSEPIPEGEYKVVASKMERKNTKKGDGFGWSQELTVIEGEYEGRSVKHWYNIHNPSDTAEKIGRAQMKRFLDCIGVLEPEDEEAMLDIPFVATITCKKDSFMKDGQSISFIKNEVSRIDPVANTAARPNTQPQTNTETKTKAPWKK